MYIRQIKIDHIRAIGSFQMDFQEGQEAGWHVLIGANGSGKSTILRSIALGIVGPSDAKALRQNWADWQRRGQAPGEISLQILRSNEEDGYVGNSRPPIRPIHASVRITHAEEANRWDVENISPKEALAMNTLWSNALGWFSVAYGPFRRFSGGEKDWNKVFYSEPRAAAHLSVFGEDVALSEPIEWLKDLDYKSLKGDELAAALLNKFRLFFKHSGLLPFGTVLKDIHSDGVVFQDGNGIDVDINQLSDGFRSILSLTFELLRQLIRVYGEQRVFKDVTEDEVVIALPGVVLIDEVDAHLHPSWQKEIGEWFVRIFPRLQFIVTTHSPIICRSARKGSIWYLSDPGTDMPVRRLEGDDFNRLVYGTITDAYATEKFGTQVLRSEESRKLLEEMAILDAKELFGTLSEGEQQRLSELRKLHIA